MEVYSEIMFVLVGFKGVEMACELNNLSLNFASSVVI